jgi:hypothetical protein
LDWQHESSLMGSIYANSYLTIAATASVDGSGGCFRIMKAPVPVDFKSSSGRNRPAYIRRAPHQHQLLNESSLFKRGWTLQEMLLSRRIVHFTDDQLLWQCQTLTASEDGYVDEGPRYTSVPSCIHPEIVWTGWAEDYSTRKLTPGPTSLYLWLARFYAQESGDTPLVGLWQSRLNEWLLWYSTQTRDSESSYERIPVFRPGRGPRWTVRSNSASSRKRLSLIAVLRSISARL